MSGFIFEWLVLQSACTEGRYVTGGCEETSDDCRFAVHVCKCCVCVSVVCVSVVCVCKCFVCV